MARAEYGAFPGRMSCRGEQAAALEWIYTAPTVEVALAALTAFEQGHVGSATRQSPTSGAGPGIE